MQRPHLVERARRKHGIETRIDPAVEFPTLRRKEHPDGMGGFQHRRQAAAVPVRDRAAGRVEHFERAGDAGAVGGVQPCGSSGIAVRKLGMKGGSAGGFEPAADRRANLRGDRWDCRQPAGQGLEIQPAAAGEYRHLPLCMHLRQCRTGVRDETPDRIVLRGVHMAVKQMGGTCRLGCAGTRGDDREIAIDLHGIGVDDDAAETFGDGERQRRLAARGRSCDKHRPHPIVRAIHAKIRVTEIRVTEVRVAEVRVAEVRVAEVRVAEVRVTDVRVTRVRVVDFRCAMSHVATLIANRVLPGFEELARRAARALDAGSEAHWLAPGIAIDIPFTPAGENDNRHAAARLREAIGDAPVDAVVQPAAGRRKRLLLADMDSTMIGQECLDELADFVGQKAHVAAITERAMRGEIAFEPALEERVALLAGLSANVVDEVIAKRITVTPGARALVHTMRADGAHTCLVSGGFTLFTGPIAALIGFAENRGNRLEIDRDGRFTGRVTRPILGRDAKLATLVELRERLDLAAGETLVVGDGANDLLMISQAGLGVAYHAKPMVAAAAAARIDHCDLTALLYAQGYRGSEIRDQGSGISE